MKETFTVSQQRSDGARNAAPARDTTIAQRADLPSWIDRDAYSFLTSTVRLPSGHRMHYVDAGSGPPILFVHGTPSWSFEWRHVIRGLSATHRCIAPDLLGFGLSERPRDFAYTPEAHAAGITAFVEALGLRDFTLVIHDFGGPIALPLALEESSRVRRLVVLNSWMWNVADDPAMSRAARLLSSGFGRWLYERFNFSPRVIMPGAFADRKKLSRAVHAHYLAPFPDRWSRNTVLWTLARSLLGSSAHYEALWSRRDLLQRLPVLIIWGTKDPAFTRRSLDRWRQALPHAEVVELPVGHWPQEEAPDDVLEALRSFVSR